MNRSGTALRRQRRRLWVFKLGTTYIVCSYISFPETHLSSRESSSQCQFPVSVSKQRLMAMEPCFDSTPRNLCMPFLRLSETSLTNPQRSHRCAPWWCGCGRIAAVVSRRSKDGVPFRSAGFHPARVSCSFHVRGVTFGLQTVRTESKPSWWECRTDGREMRVVGKEKSPESPNCVFT